MFSLVIMMKILLSKDDFEDMIDEIKREVNRLDRVVNVVPLDTILNRIGFPSNWYEIKDL